MKDLVWNGSRRRFVGASAGFAAAIGSATMLGTPAALAQDTPIADAAADATADAAISLDHATPAELGAPSVPAATVSTASDAAPEGPIFAPYAEYGTDAAPGVFPRVIRHAFGETTIEMKPERVVVLDAGELDTAVYLGILPVGSVEFELSRFPESIAAQAEAIEIVGTLAEPNIEAILALKPDLILSSQLRHNQGVYDLLATIAPTVFALQPGVTFRQNFKLYAQALGLENEARAFIDSYETGVRALNSQLPDPRPTTSIVQIRADQVRFYQRANFLGHVLTDLGFPRNEAENVDDFAFSGSQEHVGTYADGELILLAVSGGSDNELATEILASPVWATLPAVQANNVLEGPNETLIAGVSYAAAIDVVNLIAEHFGIAPVVDVAS